jgi:hypothetical protein
MSQPIQAVLQVPRNPSDPNTDFVAYQVPQEAIERILAELQPGRALQNPEVPNFQQRSPLVPPPPPRRVVQNPEGFNFRPILESYSSLKIKEKALAKKDLEKETEDCAICSEKHPMMDCVITKCGHLFGKGCLQNWHIKTCTQTKLFSRPFSKCPMCREPVNNVVGFRERAKKQK